MHYTRHATHDQNHPICRLEGKLVRLNCLAVVFPAEGYVKCHPPVAQSPGNETENAERREQLFQALTCLFREAASDVAEQLMPEEEIRNVTTTNCCIQQNSESECHERLKLIAYLLP